MLENREFIKRQIITINQIKENLKQDFKEIEFAIISIKDNINSSIVSQKMNYIVELSNDSSNKIISSIEKVQLFLEEQQKGYQNSSVEMNHKIQELIKELDLLENPFKKEEEIKK